MPDVFVSYSRRDKEFVRAFHENLESAGRTAWVDWENIPLTSDWWEEIKKGIEESDSFLFIISPDSVQSDVCRQEIDYAVQSSKRFVPILYRELVEEEDQAALHPQISSHNWTFFRETDDFDQSFTALLGALDTDLDHVRLHTNILTRALEWDRRNRDQSTLLRGSQLQDAEHWHEQAEAEGKQPAVNDLQHEYIRASRQIENWRRRERMLQVIISIAFVAALIALGVAFWQYLRAEAALLVSQDLSLAANSQVALDNNNTDLAIALALEASEGAESRQEVERALADASYSPGARLVFTQHQAAVETVAYNPAGNLALSADAAGVAYLWNPLNGQVYGSFTSTDNAAALVAAFSPNGRFVALGDEAGIIQVWDIRTPANVGDPTHILAGHEGAVRSLAFSPDSLHLASGGDDRTLRIWDLNNNRQLHRMGGHTGPVVAVAFHPTAPIVVSFAIDTSPLAWDLATGRVLERFNLHRVTNEPNLSAARIGALVFAPDGRHVLSSFGITLRWWNFPGLDDMLASTAAGGSSNASLQREYLGHGSFVNSIALSPDASFALSSSWRENSIRMWNVNAGVEIRRFEGHDSVINSLAISPNGRYVLSGSDDTTVRVWDLYNGAEVDEYAGHGDDVYGIAMHPDGERFASAGDDFNVRLWDIESSRQVGIYEGHTNDVWTVDFSPDGALLASGGEDNTIRIWDTETQEELRRLEGHTGWVTTLTFSDDGTELLTGSNDGTIRLWDVATGAQTWCFGEEEGCVGSADGQLRAVAFTPDGTRILAGADNPRIIDRASGEVLFLLASDSRVNTLDIRTEAGRQHLITGHGDGTLRLWDPETGELLRVFFGHSGQVRSVEFSPDEMRILSASADATVRLWDVATGLEMRRFEGHTEWVNAAAFTLDGQFAVSGSWDDTLIRWHIHSMEELINWTGQHRFVRDLSCNERLIYLVGLEDSCDELDATPVTQPTYTAIPDINPTDAPDGQTE